MGNKLAFMKEFEELCKKHNLIFEFCESMYPSCEIKEYTQYKMEVIKQHTGMVREKNNYKWFITDLEKSIKSLEDELSIITENGEYGIIDGDLYDFNKQEVIRQLTQNELDLFYRIRNLKLKLKEYKKVI